MYKFIIILIRNIPCRVRRPYSTTNHYYLLLARAPSPSLLLSLLSHSGAAGGRAATVTVAKKGNAAMATLGRPLARGRAGGRAGQTAGKEEGGRRRGPTSPARFLEFFEGHRKALTSEGNSSSIGGGTDMLFEWL